MGQDYIYLGEPTMQYHREETYCRESATVDDAWPTGQTRPSARSIMKGRIFASSVLAVAIIFFIYDLAVDALLEAEFGSPHFVIEFIVFVGVSMALALNVRDIRRLRVRLFWEERRNVWLSGALAETIDDQMDEWRLTRSEKDVAWMIIKGYRFSEIAQARGVKESTPRLQATSVYAKAGVSGRAEFVAEILQPLLMSIPENASQEKTIPAVETEAS